MDKNNHYNPLGEVFGFPVSNVSDKANRYRKKRLCPFHNCVPNCTKDKANDPLGVCSVNHNGNQIVTCPVRFREEWIIVENAAKFFFDEDTQWTSLSEIRLFDKNSQSTGNIDYVVVSYDEQGNLTDFGSLEVQAVYISGNLRNPFKEYIKKQDESFSWKNGYNSPKPDYLSSSRKRLVPQMLYKGGILKVWKKKQAVALQKSFFDTLPELPRTTKEKADIAWFLYDLVFNKEENQYNLKLVEIIYTEFESALLKIITPEPGKIEDFVSVLQEKLNEKLDKNSPDAPCLTDILSQ